MDEAFPDVVHQEHLDRNIGAPLRVLRLRLAHRLVSVAAHLLAGAEEELPSVEVEVVGLVWAVEETLCSVARSK